MELTDSHINTIKDAFGQMQTQEDLLALLNYAKPFLYGEKTKSFSLKQLTYYAYAKGNVKRYSTFAVKKKSGGFRTIHAPVDGLKAIQKVLALALQCVFEPHAAAKGFVQGRSIVDNAKVHTDNNYVYNIDLKDFFPSIEQARIWKCLQLKPFNLSEASSVEIKKARKMKAGNGVVTTSDGRKIYYRIMKDRRHYLIYKDKGDYEAMKKVMELTSKENGDAVDDTLHSVLSLLILKKEKERLSKLSRLDLANLIAALCCTEMEVERLGETGIWERVRRRVLPQGAPTSPVLTNVVCQRLDYLLTGVSKRFGLQYSRYADDITFSSQHNVYQQDSDFIKELHRIIREQGFHIKESKVRLQKRGYRQEVTGLTVNEKVNVPKRYVKQIRQWLYYWERYGYERFNTYFLPLHLADKGHIYYSGKPDMANALAGKLDYLKMVKGGDNDMYLKLKNRFDNLTNRNNQAEEPTTDHLDTIIERLLTSGLGVAMKLYKPT